MFTIYLPAGKHTHTTDHLHVLIHGNEDVVKAVDIVVIVVVLVVFILLVLRRLCLSVSGYPRNRKTVPAPGGAGIFARVDFVCHGRSKR